MRHGLDGEVVALLSRLAGVDYRVAPGDWERLLGLLNLALDYQPAVALVLAEGRWRQAANVRAYVATAAVRLAVRLGIDPRQGEVLESPVRLAQGGSEPTTVDSLAHYVGADGELRDVITEAPEYPGDAAWSPQPAAYPPPTRPPAARRDSTHQWDEETVPEWLWDHRRAEIAWARVAEVACARRNMRPIVAAVLRARFDERLGRSELLRRARTAERQRAISAAWKWIERNWEHIAVVLASPTERHARDALFGAPAPSAGAPATDGC